MVSQPSRQQRAGKGTSDWTGAVMYDCDRLRVSVEDKTEAKCAETLGRSVGQMRSATEQALFAARR